MPHFSEAEQQTFGNGSVALVEIMILHGKICWQMWKNNFRGENM